MSSIPLHHLKINIYIQTAFKYVSLGHPCLLISKPINYKANFLLASLTWMSQGCLKPNMSQTQLMILPSHLFPVNPPAPAEVSLYVIAPTSFQLLMPDQREPPTPGSYAPQIAIKCFRFPSSPLLPPQSPDITIFHLVFS